MASPVQRNKSLLLILAALLDIGYRAGVPIQARRDTSPLPIVALLIATGCLRAVFTVPPVILTKSGYKLSMFMHTLAVVCSVAAGSLYYIALTLRLNVASTDKLLKVSFFVTNVSLCLMVVAFASWMYVVLAPSYLAYVLKVTKFLNSLHLELNQMLDIMDKIKEIVTSLNSKMNGNKEDAGVTIPALCRFFVQLPEEFNSRLKSRFKRSIKDEDGYSTISTRKHTDSSSIFDVSLEGQLRAWKENPIWIEQPPDIKVTVPKGSLSHLTLDVNVGLPPDALYNIVTDPDNKRVFKNIKEVISRKVLVDEGTRQVVEVEQAALWRFLWWSGTISVHVLVDQNRVDYTMKFKQLRAGFMKRFEGCWKMEPLLLDTELCRPFKPETVKDYVSYTKGKGRIGSKLSLEQIIEPAIVPPPPISWYLRGITTRTTEMLINDLLAEAARIRGVSSNENTIEHIISEKIYDKCQLDELCDIKERWAMRRKNSRQSKKRLLLATKMQGDIRNCMLLDGSHYR